MTRSWGRPRASRTQLSSSGPAYPKNAWSPPAANPSSETNRSAISSAMVNLLRARPQVLDSTTSRRRETYRPGYARGVTDVMRQPSMRLTATVLGAPDAQELAAFYRRLLGWAARVDEPGWVALSAPDGGAGLSFQTETAYVSPTWTSRSTTWRPPGPTRSPRALC